MDPKKIENRYIRDILIKHLTVIVGERKFFRNQNLTGVLVFFITVNIIILGKKKKEINKQYRIPVF